MRNFESIAILGGGESGVGAAILAKAKGKEVFLSDFGEIRSKYKKELEAHKIPFEERGHSLERLKEFDLVVKSPGIGDHTEVVIGLNNYQVPIISEIEFGFYFTQKRIIGVTGSNGKTTTTGLIFYLLKEAGVAVEVGGNIGESFARLVSKEADTEVYVLELSSFQLDGIQEFKPEIAVLLNITPDHLDRYDYKMENYVKSKWRIAMNQDEGDLLIVNANLDKPKTLASRIEIIEEHYKNELLSTESGEVFDISKTKLKGQHNRFNALCAIEVALQFGLSKEQIEAGLNSFVNAPHRMQFVQEVDGVAYINDSKATNVDAVFYALDAMDKNVIWIVGGKDKGNDYKAISLLEKEKVKRRIYLGVDNSKLIQFFGEARECMSMLEAVKFASEYAEKGDVVLLSPACASFDLFKNYVDRGDQFVEAVKGLGS